MTKSKEDAVSPVIGVILMVAVTVILAAVIAAFVFGMAGNTSKTKIVAVTAEQNTADQGNATYQGGQDANQVAWIDVISPDGSMTFIGTQNNNDPTATPVVGTRAQINALTAAKDKVTATAHFFDGTVQVVLDTTI